MSFLTVMLIVGLPALAIFSFGGFKLSRLLRDIDLRSVSGALLGVVIIARFLLYTALSLPLSMLMNFLFGKNSDSIYPGISIPFNIQFDGVSHDIQNANGENFRNAAVSELAGKLQFANPDWVIVTITLTTVMVLLFIAHAILLNSQTVLKTLYDRSPFDEHNAVILKKIAVYGLVFWGIYVANIVIVTAYVQSQLVVDNIQLSMVDFEIMTPLLICCLIYVLSEVFRVGYELKRENELTV